MKSRRQSVEQWATETKFDTPLDWGEIEREVLRRRHAPLPDEPASARISDLAIDISYYLWLAVIIGAPIWALVAVLAGVFMGPTQGELWINIARLPLVATVGVPATLLLNSRRGERLAVWEVLVLLADAVLPFASYAILASGSDASSANATAWLALAVAVISLLCFVSIAIISGRSRRRRADGGASAVPQSVKVPSSFYLRQRCLAARERVLGILDRRGLVNLQDAKKAQMLKMPLGSWGKIKS